MSLYRKQQIKDIPCTTHQRITCDDRRVSRRKKKHVSLERERLSRLKKCTRTVLGNRLKKPVFSPFRFPKTKPSFFFIYIYFFCCIFTFHLLCFECVFQWDASEKLPALLYSSFTLCSLPISW